MKILSHKLMCSCYVFFIACVSFANSMRTWTGIDGKSIRAYAVKCEYDFYSKCWVYLKREDGKDVKVLFDKLSSEDQLYVNWYLRSCHPLERLMELVPLMLDQAESLLQGGQDNEARKICSAIDRFAANNDAMFNEILIPTRLVYLKESDNRIMNRSFTRGEVVSLVRLASYVQTGRYNFDFFATPAEKEAAAAEAVAQREQMTQQEILSTLQSIDSELRRKRLDEWSDKIFNR